MLVAMKSSIVVILCFVALGSGIKWDLFQQRHGLIPLNVTNRASKVDMNSILLPLDNFDSSNKGTWKMRFMSNDEFLKEGSPIFVFLGGEWTITEDYLQAGLMYDTAKDNNAYMLYTEHRFYGNSYPTKDLSTENLKKYFSTDQALADVINLLRTIKKVVPALAKSKVVVFGGSYSGNMATWIREKYPDDIFAAHASSAPIYLKADFTEYHEVVKQVLGDECSNTISNAFKQVLLQFGTPEGVKKVQKDFNTCLPVDTNDPMDVSRFFQTIGNTFGGIVQYDKCGQARQVCDILIDAANKTDEYTGLHLLLKALNQGNCIPTLPIFVESVRNTAIIPGEINRQWVFQNCFQIGAIPTSDSGNTPFLDLLPVETVLYKSCELYFDAPTNKYTPQSTNLGVKRTNWIYGGRKPNVTRVVSVLGLSDPWHPLGLTEDLNSESPVILVPGASHVFDLTSDDQCDTQAMIDARSSVRRIITGWLQDAK